MSETNRDRITDDVILSIRPEVENRSAMSFEYMLLGKLLVKYYSDKFTNLDRLNHSFALLLNIN